MLGIIADDFTGASDIASFLTENGLRTVQMNGVPSQPLQNQDRQGKVEAIVISLKSRSNPVDEAVQQSLHALTWLQKNGCTQFYFKYCSTFDSTAKGNIGSNRRFNAGVGDRFHRHQPCPPHQWQNHFQRLFVRGRGVAE